MRVWLYQSSHASWGKPEDLAKAVLIRYCSSAAFLSWLLTTRPEQASTDRTQPTTKMLWNTTSAACVRTPMLRKLSIALVYISALTSVAQHRRPHRQIPSRRPADLEGRHHL